MSVSLYLYPQNGHAKSLAHLIKTHFVLPLVEKDKNSEFMSVYYQFRDDITLMFGNLAQTRSKSLLGAAQDKTMTLRELILLLKAKKSNKELQGDHK